jgi:Protein of unknown function (DUF1236)
MGTPLADLAFAGLDRNQEEELMTYFRHAAIVAAALAGATTASAQTTIITREPAESRMVTTEPLELTPVQRRTIYRTIVRERMAPAEPTIEYRVGARVPGGVRLYSVPQEVAVEVPAIRSYKYMVVNNRVVLVDPATSQVVEEVVD